MPKFNPQIDQTISYEDAVALVGKAAENARALTYFERVQLPYALARILVSNGLLSEPT